MTHKPKLVKLVYLTIVCLFFCILFLHYPVLAGDFKTVKIKKLEDYTDEEKEFLQERWELGGVDSVVSVLEGWVEISRMIRLKDSPEVSSLFIALSGSFTIVPTKEWKRYSDGEKEVLRMRWTEEKINAVVMALKDRREMPGFVAKLESVKKPSQLASWDLRGIQLQNHDLDSVYLGGTYLQGAYLLETSLRGAKLNNANLEGATLMSAKLQGTYLSWAELQGAVMKRAELQSAHLLWTKLQGANLSRAVLQNADIREANLEGAYMSSAILQGANLQGANLQDANLYRTRFDSTYLWLVNLETAKNIKYIIWGDSLDNRYFIGEEIEADSTKTYEDFRIAEIAYRDLKTLYKKELMDDVAAEFHYRENEVITKRYLSSLWPPWNTLWGSFRYVFLRLTFGYGSRPFRLFWFSLSIIGLFGFIFFLMTRPKQKESGISLVETSSEGKETLTRLERKRLLRKCFYFSLLSFATFGYGAIKPKQWVQLFLLEPVEYKPVRWARIFVGIEAALGIWIFALLVTVLFGK